MGIAIVGALLLIVGWTAFVQVRLYYETPHDDGDAVVYVERGRPTWSSTWIGMHYATVVVTEREFLLNDVLTLFSKYYANSQPFTHAIERNQIIRVETEEYRPTPVSITFNLKVDFTDSKGEAQSTWVKAKDPRSIEHYLRSPSSP